MKEARRHRTHTKTDFVTVTLDLSPDSTLILGPVNRRRKIWVYAFYPSEYAIAVVISVKKRINITPAFNGNFMLISPLFSFPFDLGPNQRLYGAWINPETPPDSPRVISLRIEDQSDEGMFTDIGTGIEDEERVLDLDDQIEPPPTAEDDLGDRVFKEEN